MNRKTRAILSLAVMLSLGTAAPVWAAEAPPAPQVQQQEPDFVTTADQAIRDIRTVGFVDTDGSKLKAIVLSYGTLTSRMRSTSPRTIARRRSTGSSCTSTMPAR